MKKTNNSVASYHLRVQSINSTTFEKVNIMICICLCAIVSWPYLSSKVGLITFVLLYGVWLLTINLKALINYFTYDILMICCWFVTFLPYMLVGQFVYGAYSTRATIIVFTLFVSGLLITHYYMHFKKDYIALGKIAFFSTIFYTIGSLQTYLGLKKHPLASRMLAVADESIKQNYVGLGIGGFGFIYSSVFIIIALSYFLFSNKYSLKNKIFIYIALTMMVLMIFRASYTIAIMFMIVGLFLVFLIRGKKSLFIFTLIAFLILLFFPSEVMGKLLIQLTETINFSETLKVKLLDFAEGFISGNFGSQTLYRTQLYLGSLKTFINNPLFGVYGPFGNKIGATIGGHSGWLDLMAYYGIFSSIPLFIGIILTFRKQLMFYYRHKYYSYLLIVQILFIIFGFINPTITIYELGFVMFVIVPSLPFLPYAFSKNKKKDRK